MNTNDQFSGTNQSSRQRHTRVYLIVSAVLCCCFALAAITTIFTAHTPGSPTYSVLAQSARETQAMQQNQGLDPNRLADPASYDTRPCMQHPSDASCSGRYPVSPPHVSPSLGVQNGAGACINQASKVLENQSVTDALGNSVGTLQLWWSTRCSSYFAILSLSVPLNQVSSAQVWVQQESDNGFVQWFDSVSNLSPTVVATQATGPVTGSDLTVPDLYSPLIYAPSAPVSAHISLQLTDTRAFANFSASFGGGIKQYVGAA